MLKTSSFLLAVLCGLATAIPVDNGVEGDPEIECGPTAIQVNFNTRNEFEGHVYVKGLFAEAGCRTDATGRQVAGIDLPFDSCNVRRQRSLNPRGVFVTATVIITFHPSFVTKVDRAYRIQCFYMEADKTVSTELEVSMLTTEFRTQNVLMPVCRYEIRDGSPTGDIVQFAIVGQPVYHKWTCDTETVDTFCMIVHSCFVDDSNGDSVDLIGPTGCANDRYLLNNPEYISNLMAGVEAHVFKYADRPQLYFQCQITILVKEPGLECPKPECGTPSGHGAGSANPTPGPVQKVAVPFPIQAGSPYNPTGNGPAGGSATRAPAAGGNRPATPAGSTQLEFGGAAGRGARKKRSAVEGMDVAGVLDVGATLDSLDVDEQFNNKRNAVEVSESAPLEKSAFCMSPGKFVAFASIAGATFVVVISLALIILFKKRSGSKA